jgi:hypothetical protein
MKAGGLALTEPDRILIKDSISIDTPSPRQSKRFKPSSNANTSMEFDSEFESDEEDITADMLELFIQGVKPLSHDKSTHIRVIAKLPNSEQSSKGKVKTHKYINRQNQSTTGQL